MPRWEMRSVPPIRTRAPGQDLANGHANIAERRLTIFIRDGAESDHGLRGAEARYLLELPVVALGQSSVRGTSTQSGLRQTLSS